MTPSTNVNVQQGAGRAPLGWVSLLYFSVTILVNLSVLAMMPGFIRPAYAARCIALATIPIVWGVYLPFRCRFSATGCFVSGLAVLGAIYWLFVAVQLVSLLLSQPA
jgi:hypothetical protein